MGHYASEVDYYDNHKEQVWTKKKLEESIKLLYEFRQAAYTTGIDYELNSILRFYQAKLYELRHVEIDS